VAIDASDPLVSTGDTLYFPVCSQIHWRQGERYEHFDLGSGRLPKRFLGRLYLHVKHLKAQFGFGNLEPEACRQAMAEFERSPAGWPLAHSTATRLERAARDGVNAVEYCLRTRPAVRQFEARVFGRADLPLRMARAQRIATDFAAIDWLRDLHEVISVQVPPDASPQLARKAANRYSLMSLNT
jgi:hypothetical protein